VYTNLRDRQPDRPLTNVAVAHDMHAASADGNDVEAVLKTTRDAVGRARSGGGPSFLQFDTYRWREHCGPNYDNQLGYRTIEEYEEWRAKDPIELTRRKLRALSLLSEEDEKRMAEELQAQIDAAFEFAKAAPLPEASQASQFVYA
jgi:pyruvate dehydrogenase E1 component alpha subunit